MTLDSKTKQVLLNKVIQVLESEHQSAIIAAAEAHATATHSENVAENKYDTLGLEAAYLAHGQSQRVLECEKELTEFKKLRGVQLSPEAPATLGSLVYLRAIEDVQEGKKEEKNEKREQAVFLGPGAAGLKINIKHREFIVITPSAPLGRAIMGKHIDDEIVLKVGNHQQHFEITHIC